MAPASPCRGLCLDSAAILLYDMLMALVKGTNCGFVTEAPEGDPGETAARLDGEALAGRHTAPVGAAQVTEIGWYCCNATEEANFEVGIYDHNVGDDNPEVIVGWDKTNAKGTDAGWKRCTGLNISITPETVYWIAVQLDETATQTDSDLAGDAGEKRDRKWSQTELTDPWGVTGQTTTHLVAIYAVYEGAAENAAARHASLRRDMALGEDQPGLYI